MPHNHRYPPPISLRALFDALGSDALRALALALPGAVEQQAKGKEAWRVALAGPTFVLCYQYSATVAGEDAERQQEVAAALRRAVPPELEADAADAADAALQFIVGMPSADASADAYPALASLLTQWDALGEVGRRLAYQEMRGRVSEDSSARWYVGTMRALWMSYTYGYATCPPPAPEPLRVAARPDIHRTA